jgi:hypothetical protein
MPATEPLAWLRLAMEDEYEIGRMVGHKTTKYGNPPTAKVFGDRLVICHVPGRNHIVPDALSRLHSHNKDDADKEPLEMEVRANLFAWGLNDLPSMWLSELGEKLLSNQPIGILRTVASRSKTFGFALCGQVECHHNFQPPG